MKIATLNIHSPRNNLQNFDKILLKRNFVVRVVLPNSSLKNRRYLASIAALYFLNLDLSVENFQTIFAIGLALPCSIIVNVKDIGVQS